MTILGFIGGLICITLVVALGRAMGMRTFSEMLICSATSGMIYALVYAAMSIPAG
ncbi:Uncharacterised protein [Mycobacteroides abscessus subsp. abscessus]|uniref:hypothetical protein n=1 Tax=Mycobacteroides abscessus TaxID=36809 RepID=UPI000925B38F|nr:hypothetical protein [Mycobacteroides abscessus]SHU69937.1 Uncharacterised protein [Mycobacteroides abscessus subsp. abscessus]